MFVHFAQPHAEPRVTQFAIVGNPNSGKTTIFNSLTGMHQKVGNYPGVTVERRAGKLAYQSDTSIWIVDLPGTYSLVPNSLEELIARDSLLGLMDKDRKISGIILVLDAGNLERNLYLATQITELNIPTLICCNMMDSVRSAGMTIDTQLLSGILGVPVVETVGHRKEGIDRLRKSLLTLESDHPSAANGNCIFSMFGDEEIHLEIPPLLQRFQGQIAERLHQLSLGIPGSEDALALLLLMSSEIDTRELGGVVIPPEIVADVDQAIAGLKHAGMTDLRATMVEARHQYVRKIAQYVIHRSCEERPGWHDRLDRILTHPIWGISAFSTVMFLMFIAIFSWASPLMDGIESLLNSMGNAVTAWIPPGILQSLLVDGVIAGVGAVIVFLPQICILFLFIGLLEDTGYMARASVVMNRCMSKVGLPGKSFIPLLSSFACAIPGIMATRTIENWRDRFVTILIAPLMSCSARLPVYVILIGAVFAGNIWLQAGVLLSLYMMGIAMGLLVALILKRTIFKAPQRGFIIELPPYRRPHLGNIIRTMWERSVLFLKDAGTIIFAISIVLWALAYFPRSESAVGQANPGAQLRNSYLGRIGHAIEPAIEPLGFDWKIGVGIVASFAAREVFVSTMGIVYGIDEDVDESSPSLREKMRHDVRPDGSKIYTPLVGISLLVFYALACQCVSTLGVVRRETNSWRWPAFMFLYMSSLAYISALLVYQIGSRLT